MNTSIITSTTSARRVAPRGSPDTHRLVAFGQDRGWDIAVLGLAPCPDEQVRVGDWLIVPAHQDSSLIPARALERVQAIYAAGLRPKSFVLVHEAPLQLAGARQDEPNRSPWMSRELKSLLVKGALGGLALGVAALAVTAVLPLLLVVAAVAIDPILIAITDDDYWIEIDRWQVK